jgi:hypothetical protein
MESSQNVAESQLEHQVVDWLLTRLRRSSMKETIQQHAKRETGERRLTFQAFHHYLADFPVYFDVHYAPNSRKQMSLSRVLTRFGDTPVAKHYYRMLRDYRHLRRQRYELALVFNCPDLVAAVDRVSKVREPNFIKAAVLHANTHDADDTPSTRIVWRADTSALPPYVKLDPPVLVIETLASYYRRIVSQWQQD